MSGFIQEFLLEFLTDRHSPLCMTSFVTEYFFVSNTPKLFFFIKKKIDSISSLYCSPEYDRLLFTMVDRLQKLNLDENERNLLKLVGFFDNGKFSEDLHLPYYWYSIVFY